MGIDKLSRNPFINLSGYILAVIGFLFSIYTFESGKLIGQIFYISDSKLTYAPIDPKYVPEEIAIHKYAGFGRIYVTQVTVWNGGNLSFEPQLQRTPIILSGGRSTKIFDTKIINSKSAIDSNFEIKEISDDKFALSWKTFDPDEGFKIQLIHSGEPESITINAKFAPNYNLDPYRPGPLYLVGFLALTGMLIAIHIYLYYGISRSYIDKLSEENREPVKVLYIIGGLILAGILSTYLFYQFVDHKGGITPFSFTFEGFGGISADAH